MGGRLAALPVGRRVFVVILVALVFVQKLRKVVVEILFIVTSGIVIAKLVEGQDKHAGEAQY